MSDISDRLAGCYTGVVHDVLRGMGLRDFALPPRLRPILPDRVLAGPAFTIEGRVDPRASAHETLLAWTGLLSTCPPGHVWVSQPNDDAVAHMGELSAETLADRGVRGAVMDGMARDVSLVMAQGFQVWCTGFTPRDVVGWWLPAATGEPVRIGEVEIRPGDYMLGDRDGMLRIPRDILHEVVAQAEEAMGTESAIRAAIRGGMDPQTAYLEFGKF